MPAEEDGDLMLCHEHGLAYQRDRAHRVNYDRAYYEKCAAALRLLAEGESALSETEDGRAARGLVRVSVPTTYGHPDFQVEGLGRTEAHVARGQQQHAGIGPGVEVFGQQHAEQRGLADAVAEVADRPAHGDSSRVGDQLGRCGDGRDGEVGVGCE